LANPEQLMINIRNNFWKCEY